MAYRAAREAPDRRVGGMSEAEKGTGKLHMLHEGEIVLNRPTTQMLLKKLGISKETAMKMSGPALMKKVKEGLSGEVKNVVGNVTKGVEAVKKGVANVAERVKRMAPKRMKGGMSRPARKAPSRMKGGMSAPGSSSARAERSMRLGQYPDRDSL